MEVKGICVPDDLTCVSWSTVRESLELLTKQCQVEMTRTNLDIANYKNLEILLNSLTSQKCSVTERERIGIFAEAFRLLRNSVAACKRNQDAVREESNLFDLTATFLKCQAEVAAADTTETERGNGAELEDRKVAIRCAIQFLANCIPENLSNSESISRQFPEILTALMKVYSDDEKIIQYSAMVVHNALCLTPEVYTINTELECFLNNLHLEFVIYAVESIVQHNCFVETFENLNPNSRVQMLTFLNSRSDLIEKLSEDVIKKFKTDFVERSDFIFKSSLDNRDQTFCWEIASLLEVLCAVSLSNKSTQLKSDGGLMTTVLFLLKQVYETGKQSNEMDNVFSPVQDIGKLTSQSATLGEGDEIRAHPTFLFKANLIRLVGNMVYRNKLNQDKVRELDCIPIILDSSTIDARNPFIEQWSVLAIRNLCEGNEENQAYIKEVQRVDTEDRLSKLHLVGIN